jgi:hypothetical protein
MVPLQGFSAMMVGASTFQVEDISSFIVVEQPCPRTTNAKDIDVCHVVSTARALVMLAR